MQSTVLSAAGFWESFATRFFLPPSSTYHWGDTWDVPLVELGIIIVVVALAVILAVRNPIRKMKETSIVDTISAS